jgi:hypothetical protein
MAFTPGITFSWSGILLPQGAAFRPGRSPLSSEGTASNRYEGCLRGGRAYKTPKPTNRAQPVRITPLQSSAMVV